MFTVCTFAGTNTSATVTVYIEDNNDQRLEKSTDVAIP